MSICESDACTSASIYRCMHTPRRAVTGARRMSLLGWLSICVVVLHSHPWGDYCSGKWTGEPRVSGTTSTDVRPGHVQRGGAGVGCVGRRTSTSTPAPTRIFPARLRLSSMIAHAQPSLQPRYCRVMYTHSLSKVSLTRASCVPKSS